MKQTTVRGALIRTFAYILLVSFIAQAILFAAIQIFRTRRETFVALEENTHAAAIAVDREIELMRTTVQNISYATHMEVTLPSSLTPSGVADEDALLSTVLSLIVLPTRTVDQVDFYTPRGKRISAGMLNTASDESAETQDWYAPLMESDTSPRTYLYFGTDDALSRYMTNTYGQQFLALVTENYNAFDEPSGCIQIRQHVGRVLAALINYESTYGEQIYFFDREGQQIYPLEPAEDGLFTAAEELGFPETTRRSAVNGTHMRFCCAPSYTGSFYTVIAIPSAHLFRPIREQLLTPSLFTLVLLAASILLANLAARRFTRPIDTICEQIAGIDIEHPAPLPPLDTELVEMRTLHGHFDQMQSTLSEHVGKLLLLQKQEMQSRMLALQAQMNPHFLFNSLAALQAMSDEGMNDEISRMCQAMANILRYISSDSAQEVPLEEELRHTADYLTCMAMRYPGDLIYEIDVPEALNGALVPKLCVQLLVENAVKYAASHRPPYRIRIAGELRGDGYELRIQDNGPGFAADTLDALTARMEEIRRTSTLPSLKIDGMGILNLFIRFYLLYDNQFTFRLENNPEGGACVVIGANRNGTEV